MATTHFYSYASRHDRHPSLSPDAPPSPTLTNPDMILPYSVVSSSPTPLASSPLLPPPELHISSVSGPSLLTSNDSRPEVGIATAIRMPLRIKPNPPTRVTLSYSGYEHGAPLSDIGEEETTPRSKASRKSRSPSPLGRTSPTKMENTLKHKKRLSDHSSSSRGSDVGDWENFDSSKMMNGKLAADVAVAKDEEAEADAPDTKPNAIPPTNANDEIAMLNAKAEKILENARKRLTHMEDNLSKARQSMLSTSRSSPNIGGEAAHQPGGLYRSISLAGASHRKSRPLYPLTRASTVTHSRGGSDSTMNTTGKRLSIIPEIRSASALEYSRGLDSPSQTLPSPTGRLAATSPVSSHSYNSPLRVLEEEGPSPSTNRTSPENIAPRGLGINTLPTASKDVTPVPVKISPLAILRPSSSASTTSTKELRDQMSDLKSRIAELKAKAEADSAKRKNFQTIRSPSPFTNAQAPEQWYTTAPEYKETGGPINANAGQGWSPSVEKTKRFEKQKYPSTPNMRSFLDIDAPSTGQTGRSTDARTDINTPTLHNNDIKTMPTAVEKPDSSNQDSHYEEAKQSQGDSDDDQVAASEEEQVYLNEALEESLQDMEPDIPDVPDHLLGEMEAERHEDRLDAFDYENMFLHSALGNYAGAGTTSRSDSGSDEGSVETRRANQQTPTVDRKQIESEEETESSDDQDQDQGEVTDEVEETRTDDEESPLPDSDVESDRLVTPDEYQSHKKPWMKNSRNNSLDSTSTAATFATATEGGSSKEVDEGAPVEILNWANGNGTGFPKPPVTSPKREQINTTWTRSPITGVFTQTQQPHRSPITTSYPKNPLDQTLHKNLSTTPAFQHDYHHAHQPDLDQDQDQDFSEPESYETFQSETDHPANTEILMESLIKLADPEFQVPEPATMTGGAPNVFNDIDKNLVLSLLRAVGSVCNDVLKAENRGDVREVKILRRRLDAARRGLEGEEAR